MLKKLSRRTFSLSPPGDKTFMFQDLNKLPYLMQDLMLLGSIPDDILFLIKNYIDGEQNILEVACGRGHTCFKIAETLNYKTTGIDIVASFIREANLKASKLNLENLCTFYMKDINNGFESEEKYDTTIFIGLNKFFSDYESTLEKLKKTIKPKGHLIIYGPFIKEITGEDYFDYNQWQSLFKKTNFEIVNVIIREDSLTEEKKEQSLIIKKRITRLAKLYSCGNIIFEEYLIKTLSEDYSLENNVIAATWLLKKI